MAIDFFEPDSTEDIIARIKTYVKGELKSTNPTEKNAVLYSLIVALANMTNDNNQQILLDILPNIFPQYCKSESSLDNHAYIKNVPRNQATPSSGKATISGLVGNSIPLGSVLIANNIQYRTSATADITEQSIALSKLSVNGTLVTATTSASHNFASGLTITISGAETEALNGSFLITSTGLNTFTYSISEETQVEETGEGLLATGNIAILSLKSTVTGSDTNLKNGDALALSEAIEGVDSNAYVQYSGISGGTDIESFSSWKDKTVDRYRNPITAFNVERIKQTLLAIAGITKVWVYEITPEVGQVTIFFIRGNDDTIIPDYNEIQTAKEAVLKLRTVKDDPDDVFVLAPTQKVVNFTFSNVVPNTSTMKQAIKNSLKQFFEDEVDLGDDNYTTLTLKELNSAIGNSFDSETGAKLQDYTMSLPSSNISLNFGELPVLGDVTFL